MYAVLVKRQGRSFFRRTGQLNWTASGPYMSSLDALVAAKGDATLVVEINPVPGLTDRFVWRDLHVTPVID